MPDLAPLNNDRSSRSDGIWAWSDGISCQSIRFIGLALAILVDHAIGNDGALSFGNFGLARERSLADRGLISDIQSSSAIVPTSVIGAILFSGPGPVRKKQIVPIMVVAAET